MSPYRQPASVTLERSPRWPVSPAARFVARWFAWLLMLFPGRSTARRFRREEARYRRELAVYCDELRVWEAERADWKLGVRAGRPRARPMPPCPPLARVLE
jgi:hypothetical protein